MSASRLVTATVEQVKSQLLVLRQCVGQARGTAGEAARDAFSDADAALDRLVAVVAGIEANGANGAGDDQPGTSGSGAGAADTKVSGDACSGAPLCDLTWIVEQAARRYSALFGPEVSLRLQLPGEPAPVAVRPARLERLILDLLLRARQVTPAGGTVELRVEIGDSFARLVVADGLAVPARASQVLLSASWAALPGLGHVTLESRDGQGTSFFVRLPLAE